MEHLKLNLSGIENKQQLHSFLAEKLYFPQWYGHNLDALMDCLTDLADTHVTLTGWRETAFPAEGFWETFVDAARENPQLSVTFA